MLSVSLWTRRDKTDLIGSVEKEMLGIYRGYWQCNFNFLLALPKDDIITHQVSAVLWPNQNKSATSVAWRCLVFIEDQQLL